MEKSSKISLFLFASLYYFVFALLLKISFLIVEKVFLIDSISISILTHSISGIVVLFIGVIFALRYINKPSIRMIDIVIFIGFFIILLIIEKWLFESENRIIFTSDISRDLQLKLYNINLIMNIIFKMFFFVILFLKYLKIK